MSRKERWQSPWQGLGVSPPEGLLEELLGRYSEPHRAYHTLQHLDECFAALEPARDLAARLPEVELAVWFHDAVYDPRASDNEERSARCAQQALVGAAVAPEVCGHVGALVLATRHDAVPEGDDARLLVDVDLAILGASELRFAEYERQVRAEYAWVPDDVFRRGRARILRSFVERPSIYGTGWFSERLEARARANLRRSLLALES